MSANLILDGLNTEQYRAATYDEGSILILAGAGSGKTSVLTKRIAWLIQEKGIHSNEILAVTFTNKAAKEMMSRVTDILECNTTGMWIGTFHSVALRLLSKHNAQARLPNYFQILDSQDQLNILKRIIKSFNLDDERYSARELQKFINQQKENGLRCSDLNNNDFRYKIWLNLYKEYELWCNRDGLVDFTELLLRSYELLLLNPQILNIYQKQFKHILIDEFQDTNKLQYRWLKLLASDNNTVFAVGDDDQSIYSFRGAQVSNIKSFIQDYKIAEPILLEQNYRSTTNILSAANMVIGNNQERIGKKLWTSNLIGEKIRLYEGYTEEDEAYFVCDEIRSLNNSGVALSDIAVLYRSNAQSRVFEQLFYSSKVPYKVYGGLRFFDRQEIKYVLAYLRLILNTNDNEAFLKVVNIPPRGIGAKTIENLQKTAIDNQVSLYDAVKLQEGVKTRSKLLLFTDLIEKIRNIAHGLSLPEIINYLIENSGLANWYQNDKKNGLERIENINELVSAVTSFKPEADSENVISSFLNHAVIESAEHQAAINEQQYIQLMTVHAAKGLEFKVVFIVGLEDGLFPHENCLRTDFELEEERRLMYVAITRAKEHLYLVRACSRLMWGKRISAPISRFVNEIPGELINNITGISKIGLCNLMNSQMLDRQEDNYYRTIDNPETKVSRVYLNNQSTALVRIGDVINHSKFGKGKVMNLNIEGTKITAEIFFIGVGKKTLDLNIAKIEKVQS